MRIRRAERFLQSYADAPVELQRAVERKIAFLLQNLHHPSLRAKKYDETRDIWQACINADWRFYFRIEGDMYLLLDMIPHPK